jgi:hypothetical protein
MVGMMAPLAAPMILMYARVGSPGEGAEQAVRRDRLVRPWLFPGLDRLLAGSDPGPMGDRTGGLARFTDGERQQCARRNHTDCGGRLPMDTAQGSLSRPMPVAVPVPDALRRVSRRFSGLPAVRASSRRLLRRLLLGSDDTFVCRRSDERALDCTSRAACPSGKTYSVRPRGCSRCWDCMCRRGRLVVVIFAAMRSRVQRRSGMSGLRECCFDGLS